MLQLTVQDVRQPARRQQTCRISLLKLVQTSLFLHIVIPFARLNNNVKYPQNVGPHFIIHSYVAKSSKKSMSMYFFWWLLNTFQNIKQTRCAVQPALFYKHLRHSFINLSVSDPFSKSRIQETKYLSTDADSSTDTEKTLVRQNLPTKKLFFRAAILHPLYAKVLKSETTSYHYFSPRIQKIQQV